MTHFFTEVVDGRGEGGGDDAASKVLRSYKKRVFRWNFEETTDWRVEVETGENEKINERSR